MRSAVTRLIEAAGNIAHGRLPSESRCGYRDVLKADWAKPSDVKQQFGNVSILQDGRVVFNIAGNKYRMIV